MSLQQPDKNQKQPIFQSIFGDSWENLPQVMKDHYAIRPDSNDKVVVVGKMYVRASPLIRLLAPIFRLTGTLVAKQGENVRVTVVFSASRNDEMFCFDRSFEFEDGDIWKFVSRMEPVGDNEIVEWTGSGVGWHACFSYENGKVEMRHKAFVFKLFGKLIPVPVSILLGRGDAVETPLDENRFDMEMKMHHPLWGKVYSYGGRFEVTKVNLDG